MELEYLSTATITHSLIKLAAEIATLHFRNLSKESGSDWAVMVTRTGAFAMIPTFYVLELLSREDGHTPYFQALAAVYAVAFAGVATSSIRREPYMGSTQQLAVPLRERFVYTLFWTIVLAVKLAFGHFYLVLPLREAIMALQHPDLCWNKESDEYTSCINLEGDDLMKALRFTPKTKYFIDEEKEDYDYEELISEGLEGFDDPLDSIEEQDEVVNVNSIVSGGRDRSPSAAAASRRRERPARLRARRRSLLGLGGNARLNGGEARAPRRRRRGEVRVGRRPGRRRVRGRDGASWRLRRRDPPKPPRGACPLGGGGRGVPRYASTSYAATRGCDVDAGGEGGAVPGATWVGPKPPSTRRRRCAFPRSGTSARRLRASSPRRTTTCTRRWSSCGS